jgi:hypothetical protein
VLGGVPSDAVLGVDESHSRCSTTAPAAPGRRCAAHGPVAGLAGSGGGLCYENRGQRKDWWNAVPALAGGFVLIKERNKLSRGLQDMDLS